ncbi:MAG: hypothetical protein MUC67_02650 [Acidobacteria bacterium]|nr:hypothetical protein [Acidobacteriota bacterium]
MFRTLLGKALAQQRAIVASGIGTGALFALGLALAVGGVYGSGPVGADSAIGSALPLVLSLGVWPFWALLAFSQAFTADRASGTEPFLLDRPVPPRRLFGARFGAALTAWSAVTVATLGLAWFLARAVYGVSTESWPLLVAVGGLLSALAACGTLLAAALGAVSLAAALLGLMLGLAALAAAVQFLRSHVVLFEAIGWFSLWPIALGVLSFPLAAWLAFTRGEPAGRGRARRAALVTGIASLAIAALFVAVTPSLIRLAIGGAPSTWQVDFAPRGQGAVLNGWRHLWVVDPDTGAPRRFIPPWSHFLGWRADGEMFAVATRATRLGGESRRERIAFYDGEGRRAAPDIALARDEIQLFGIATRGLWAGDEIFFVTAEDSEEGVLWRARPGEGRGRLAAAHLPPLTRPLQVTRDGKLYLVSYRRREQRGKGPSLIDDEAELLRFEPGTGRLERLGSMPRGRVLHSGLAPSGRYWLVDDGRPETARIVVRDLATGEELEHRFEGEAVLEWEWLADDRLAVVVEQGGVARLLLTGPGAGGSREELGSWPARPTWGWLQASADGSMLLVRDHATRGARVFHLADARWTEIPPPRGLKVETAAERVPVLWSWAGARTLVVPGAQGPLLIDVDRPEGVRTITF